MRDNSQRPAAAANTLLGSANLRYLQVAALVPQQGEQKRLRRDGGGSLGGGVKKLQPTLPTKQHDDGTLMATSKPPLHGVEGMLSPTTTGRHQRCVSPFAPLPRWNSFVYLPSSHAMEPGAAVRIRWCTTAVALILTPIRSLHPTPGTLGRCWVMDWVPGWLIANINKTTATASPLARFLRFRRLYAARPEDDIQDACCLNRLLLMPITPSIG